MVRSAGSWSQLSSPLLYLSEINNYWFSSTRLFLMRQTHLQQDQGNRPETHQLSHHIVQMAVINLHWCANTPGVDFLKFPGYCCELHQQEKIAISTLWLKWVKQEREKRRVLNPQWGRRDRPDWCSSHWETDGPCVGLLLPITGQSCKLLAQDGADCITITLSTLRGDTKVIMDSQSRHQPDNTFMTKLTSQDAEIK